MYNCTFLIAGAQTLRAPLLRLRDPLSGEHHRPDVDDGQFPGWRVHELRHQGTGLQRRSSGEEVRPFSHINMSVERRLSETRHTMERMADENSQQSWSWFDCIILPNEIAILGPMTPYECVCVSVYVYVGFSEYMHEVGNTVGSTIRQKIW